MIELKPNPGQQEYALRQPYTVNEILYGGARGGGKTFAGLIWLTEYLHHPQFRGLVIRRNSEDLSDWIERARFMYKDIGGVVTGNPAVIRFPNGAIIRTGHLKDDNTYTKYQGHEYQKMLIEELNQIPNKERYQTLVSSCRTSIPELKPQVFNTTNPGGVGHLWIKETFIDPAPPNHWFTDPDGIKRIFIPATMDDNPVLMAADPEYVNKIEALKSTNPALYRAWRHGDWDIFVGQVYGEWRPQKNGQPYHVIDKLPPGLLKLCRIFIGYDWGYRDPASAHWLAVAPENEYGVKRIYVYREMYQTERRPDEWATEVKDVIDFERERELDFRYMIMPHDTYSNLGGAQPIVNRFMDKGISVRPAEAQSHRAKINRQALLHDFLSEAPDGLPYMQVLSTCRNFIRTVPALPYSDTKPEEIDDEAEDHAYDSLTYALYQITGGKSWIVNPKPPQRDDHQKAIIINEKGEAVGNTYEIKKKLVQPSKERDWRYN